MGLLGPWLFGRGVPRGDERAAALPPSGRGARWRLWLAGPLGALRASRRDARTARGSTLPRVLARLTTARPAAALVVLLCARAVALAATGARLTHLGVPFVPSP